MISSVPGVMLDLQYNHIHIHKPTQTAAYKYSLDILILLPSIWNQPNQTNNM